MKYPILIRKERTSEEYEELHKKYEELNAFKMQEDVNGMADQSMSFRVDDVSEKDKVEIVEEVNGGEGDVDLEGVAS